MQCDRGHNNVPGSAFCGACGQQLVERSTQQSTPATPNPTSMPGTTSGDLPLGQGAVGPTYGDDPFVEPVEQSWLKKLPVGAWIAGGVGAAVILGLIIFAVVRVAAPSTTTVTVNLTVFNDDFRGCDLGLGYFDVPGSAVIVRADGDLVGTGSLGRSGTEDLLSCKFTARISDIPTDADFYTFEIGRRGTGDATRGELERNNWTYDASLGL